MNPNPKEIETEDLTQVLQIINAKGDVGELTEILEQGKRVENQPKSPLREERE